jgi:hypothetical protein
MVLKFCLNVNGLSFKTRIINGMSSGASLYSLSVAWVSFGAVAHSQMFCIVALALFCVARLV